MGDWDPKKKVVMRYEVKPDGSLVNGQVFCKHLGTIIGPRHPDFAWGDEDGKTLYLCARSGLYRMKLNVAGIRP